uniref:Uncharacterized protein n=1 Tax=Anopheles atroparvus TaxID=41427 RepID=A0A182INJ6_ANOAO
MNNSVGEFSNGETINCKNYLPPLEFYYSEYTLSLMLSLIVGCIVWLWTTFVFIQVTRSIKKHTEKNQVMVLIIANTVYLIVVTFNVVALLLPHVAVVCDIVPFVAFCWCILVFFRYLKQSVGGDSVIIALYETKALDAPKKRFFLLQLVLLITKPQIIILELVYNLITFECTIAGEPKVYFNMLKQMIILIEVGLVTLVSYKFYTTEQPAREKSGVQNVGFIKSFPKHARLANKMDINGSAYDAELLPATNGTPNDECTSKLPTIQEYLDGLNYPIALMIVGTVILSIITFSIFFKNAYHILHRTPKLFKTKSVLLLTIYPLITLFSVVSATVPRAFFLCDTVMHVYFMISAYVFFSLCMQYVNGEDALIKSTDSQTFSLRTPPLCCCLPLFKRASVTKNRLLFVRMLIMQLPVVQTALFLALNVVFVEDYGKYFVLQAVLILCRIQPLIIGFIVSKSISNCEFPITLQVQKNAVFQLCLCFEMMVLSCWASLLYKSPATIIAQG